jgi:cell division septation protein DedD
VASSNEKGCLAFVGLAAAAAAVWAVWQAILWFAAEWHWAWTLGGAAAILVLAYLITVLWGEGQDFAPGDEPGLWAAAVGTAAAATAGLLSFGCGWGTTTVAVVMGAGAGAALAFTSWQLPSWLDPLTTAERPLHRALTGLMAAAVFTSGLLYSGGPADDAEAAAQHTSGAPAKPPTPTPSAASPSSSPTETATATPPPSPSKTEEKEKEEPVERASCTGSSSNLRFSAAGGTIKTSPNPAPGHLQIKSGSVRRDGKNVKATYVLKGAAPRPGDGIPSGDYGLWFGDGTFSDAGLITMLYLNDTWHVSINDSNWEGGDVATEPEVDGNKITLTLPLNTPTDSGTTIDLSSFTHVGWTIQSKDPSGFGTWSNGCPVDGDTAGDPGDWMVEMR